MAIQPMTDEYRRARRNILVMSVLLISMKYGGITIDKFHVFGIEAKLANPNSVFVLAWLIWFYFMLSFFQYYNQEGRDKLRASLNHAITFTCGYKMAALIEEANPGRTVQRPVEYANLRKEKFLHPIFRDNISYMEKQEVKHEMIEFQFNMWKLWALMPKLLYNFMLKKSASFEYLLPIITIGTTLLYCNLDDKWQGSIINLLKGL